MKNIIQTFDRVISSKKGLIFTLISLYLISVLYVFFIYGWGAYGPVHFDDEVVYFKTALSIFNGVFDIKAFHHYPPLYPLSLLPAFLFFYPANIFTVVKFLNAIYICSVIFPVYLILHNFLSRKEIFIALSIFILSPINLIFPRSVLSENIFYPLLMWAIYFALFSSPGKSQIKDRFNDLLTGVLFSALIFTRFIAIAVVPGLLLIWLVKQFSGAKVTVKQIINLLPRVVLILLPLVISAGIWLYSGSINGVSAKEVFGFSITGNPNPLQTTPYNLVMWTVFYLSYACLMLGPGLIFFIFSAFHIKDANVDRKYYQGFFACLVVCGTFLIASIEHSWSAHYNFPDPVKLQGRYILYITPLFFITSLIFIKQSGKFTSSLVQKIVVSVVSLCLLLFSYLILFKGLLYIDNPMSISASSPDGYVFSQLDYLYLLIILVFILLYLFFNKKSQVIFGIFCAISLIIALSGNILIYKNMLYPRQDDNTLIIKYINYLDENKGNSGNPREIPITISVPASTTELQLTNWQNALLFNGFNNIVFEINDRPEEEPKIIFQTLLNNQTLYLKSFLKSEYTCGENACQKFIVSNRKYAVIKIK